MARALTAPPGALAARRWSRAAGSALVFLGLLALALVVVGIPVGWTLSTALKQRHEVIAWPPVYWPPEPQWQNFAEAIRRADLLRFGINSLFIALVTILGRVLSCSIVAFSFARLRFPGRNLLFMLLLSTLMIPHQITLIPQFVLFQTLGWVGTYLPLLVPAFFGSPFFIFLMRQYVMTIPRDLDEAARIDGASTWVVFARIVMPLCMPPLAVVAVLSFLHSWNEFLMPLIYISKYDDYTIQLGLSFLRGRFNVEWNLIMAGSILGLIPCLLIFFLAQRHLIGGIASVGLKG
ncbi:MAG TPA: carbohydrate ABC transporter permease [Chloroflexota bacterium]